jgi:hypothetical protein
MKNTLAVADPDTETIQWISRSTLLRSVGGKLHCRWREFVAANE